MISFLTDCPVLQLIQNVAQSWNAPQNFSMNGRGKTVVVWVRIYSCDITKTAIWKWDVFAVWLSVYEL